MMMMISEEDSEDKKTFFLNLNADVLVLQTVDAFLTDDDREMVLFKKYPEAEKIFRQYNTASVSIPYNTTFLYI